MILLSISLILAVCGAVTGQDDELTVTHDGNTNFILNQPVVLNTKKMYKALHNQNVVATCRYLLFKTYMDWYGAKESCENITLPIANRVKGSLATVKTDEESQDFVTLLKLGFGMKKKGKKFDRRNWSWIGLEKIINNDVKTPKKQRGAANVVPEEWRWVDNSVPDYWRWYKKMPDGEKAKHGHIYQDKVCLNKGGYWDDELQTNEMPYTCNYCGKYIVIKRHESWYSAQKSCETFGLTMAKINSPEENEDLAMAAKLMMGEEVGEDRWNNTNWIWIGTREVMDAEGKGTDVWQHHDGTALLWEHPPWDYKRQPDNRIKKNVEQQAVAFSRINNKWDDSFLNKKRPYACMCPEAACTTN